MPTEKTDLPRKSCPMCGGIVEKRPLTTNGSYFLIDPTTQQRTTVQVCEECEYMNGLHEAQVTGKRKPRRKTRPTFVGFSGRGRTTRPTTKKSEP